MSVWTGGGYEHPLTHRLRLRAGADLAHKDHAGRRFDDTRLALHAGPRWLADPRTELSVLANASRRWLGGSVERDAAEARIEAHRRLTDRVWASVHASWLDHDYRGGTGRDGPLVDLLLSGTWRIRPTVALSPAIGYSEQRTQSPRFSNRSRRLRAGISVALPRGFSMGGSAQVRWTDYPDYQFFGRTFPREDRTRTLRGRPGPAVVHAGRDGHCGASGGPGVPSSARTRASSSATRASAARRAAASCFRAAASSRHAACVSA